MPAQHHHRFSRMDDPEFDWSATAEWLQLGGLIVLPLVNVIVDELIATGLDSDGVAEVLDAGSGPGVISCELARRFPNATVLALDSAPPLLQWVHDRAWSHDLSRRVVTATADLDVDLPIDGSADLAWVSMVIHHVADPIATLQRLYNALRPGGRIVLLEFAGDPLAFADTDPIVESGAWSRLTQASVQERRERLGFDFLGHDWAADLTTVGFVDVSDQVRTFTERAPISDASREWLVGHLRRGLELTDSGLGESDIEALAIIVDQIERGERPDAFLTSERRVLVGRRPE